MARDGEMFLNRPVGDVVKETARVDTPRCERPMRTWENTGVLAMKTTVDRLQ
jgi:hypothetical protein